MVEHIQRDNVKGSLFYDLEKKETHQRIFSVGEGEGWMIFMKSDSLSVHVQLPKFLYRLETKSTIINIYEIIIIYVTMHNFGLLSGD